MINSLYFGQESNTSSSSKDIQCLKCESVYQFPIGKDDYLAHLFLSHRLIISDVEEIPLLEDYLKFWIEAFKSEFAI